MRNPEKDSRAGAQLSKGGEGRWAKGTHVEGYRRNARSTRRREDTGGTPAPLTEVRLRQSYDAGRGAKEMCHSTKRTHRLLTDFLMEVTMNSWVARETCERNRWVRFRKRTHREGVLRGVRGRKWGKRSHFWVLPRALGAYAMGYESMESWRCWLLEGLLVS